MVNQDHLHNVIKSSMGRTEPGNTVASICAHAILYKVIYASFCEFLHWTSLDKTELLQAFEDHFFCFTAVPDFLSQDHEIS